jgi:hypothetical protein
MAANARNAPEVVLLRQGSIVKKSPYQFEQSHRVTPSLRSRAGSEPFASLRGNSAKGLSRSVERSFASLRMTGLGFLLVRNCQIHLNLA